MFCSSTKIRESVFSVVKSQLFTTPDQYPGFSTEKQYFRFLLLFFYYALSEIEKVINVHFMTVGNLTNINLDYQAGIITLVLFNCWLSALLAYSLYNFLCCASFFIGFISATSLKI